MCGRLGSLRAVLWALPASSGAAKPTKASYVARFCISANVRRRCRRSIPWVLHGVIETTFNAQLRPGYLDSSKKAATGPTAFLISLFGCCRVFLRYARFSHSVSQNVGKLAKKQVIKTSTDEPHARQSSRTREVQIKNFHIELTMAVCLGGTGLFERYSGLSQHLREPPSRQRHPMTHASAFQQT